MVWNLYENNKILKPLVFSNNKTQEDVVKETIQAINEGHKVIFIKGVCGTGKSAIALNLAKELGRASIVVPVKALQKQYEDDYTNKKYLLKDNKEKLKISMITGRANFSCPFLQETSLIRQEINSKLTEFQILLNKLEERNKIHVPGNKNCNNSQLPCKIEIKEKNINQIREYLRKNPKVELADFVSLDKIRRMSIAPVCPYWSPLIPSDVDLKSLDNSSPKDYQGLNNTKYTIYQRKKGCGYYDQYQSYLDADIIIFNSEKYKLETVMNRKPATDIEIIDECDEFLDSFSSQKKIDINRLNFALGSLFADDEKSSKIINELIKLTSEILRDQQIEQDILDEGIISLKNTKILDILKNFLDSDVMSRVECDEENYCYHADEVARTFEGFFDETYISFYKEEKNLIVRLVTVSLEKMFKQMLDKNKVFVMMSGTIHSENVLREIFGIKDFKIIEAETKMPGKITSLKTGREINCKYSNFQSGSVTRERYLTALQRCIEQSVKPALVHVNSFNDLPSELEAREYNLDIMTRENLEKLQFEDSIGAIVQKFKSGQLKILYSTKCNRGADFPGETCNSIILTKYPYPNIKSLFWRILKKTKPQHYNSFYMDKAGREFLQRVYRALRSEDDHVYLLSPDSRVFDMIKNLSTQELQSTINQDCRPD